MDEDEKRWYVEIIIDKFHGDFSLENYSKAHDEIKDWLTANAPPGSWVSSCTISLGLGTARVDVYFNEDGDAAAVACKLRWT